MDLAGGQPGDPNLPAARLARPVAVAADEHAAAPHRAARGARADPSQLGCHLASILPVPQRERPLQHGYAKPVRAQLPAADVSRSHVQAVDYHVAGAGRAVGQQQHLALGSHIPQLQRSPIGHAGVVEHRALLLRDDDLVTPSSTLSRVSRTPDAPVLEAVAPNAVTALLLLAVGIVLVAGVPAGLYVVVAPVLVAFVGGVASTWLLLTKITE